MTAQPEPEPEPAGPPYSPAVARALTKFHGEESTESTDPAEPPPMKRANWLPAPASFNLSMACVAINKAFGDHFGCYLVGSSLRKRDFRDVDVRLIISDEEFAHLFGKGSESCPQLNPLWSLLCSSISLFLQTHTGLPVDFQIQQQTKANQEFGGPTHQRHPARRILSLAAQSA